MVVLFVVEVLRPFGLVAEIGDGRLVSGDSGALVACVFVVASLKLGGSGSKGKESEEVVDNVVLFGRKRSDEVSHKVQWMQSGGRVGSLRHGEMTAYVKSLLIKEDVVFLVVLLEQMAGFVCRVIFDALEQESGLLGRGKANSRGGSRRCSHGASVKVLGWLSGSSRRREGP